MTDSNDNRISDSEISKLSAFEALERFAPNGEPAPGVRSIDQDWDRGITEITLDDGRVVVVDGPCVELRSEKSRLDLNIDSEKKLRCALGLAREAAKLAARGEHARSEQAERTIDDLVGYRGGPYNCWLWPLSVRLARAGGEIELTARAKAFSGEGVREHRFLVTADTLRVWDCVAGHYTSCHAMSSKAQRRLRYLAMGEGN